MKPRFKNGSLVVQTYPKLQSKERDRLLVLCSEWNAWLERWEYFALHLGPKWPFNDRNEIRTHLPERTEVVRYAEKHLERVQYKAAKTKRSAVRGK